jgi:hypothetical protein
MNIPAKRENGRPLSRLQNASRLRDQSRSCFSRSTSMTYPYFASEAENMADRRFSATRIRKG